MQNKDNVLDCPSCRQPLVACKCKGGGGSGDSVENDGPEDHNSLTTNHRDSFIPFTMTKSGYVFGSLVSVLAQTGSPIVGKGQDSNISLIEKIDNSITLGIPSLGVIKLTFDPNILQKGYQHDPDLPLTLESFAKLTGLMISNENGDPLVEGSQTAKILSNPEFLQIAKAFSKDQQVQLDAQNNDNTSSIRPGYSSE